jgi:predicted transcriptional regulator
VEGGEQNDMVNRVNTLSIYIPKTKMDKNPVDRLMKLSRAKERSINYLVVEAIVQYLDREEKKKK